MNPSAKFWDKMARRYSKQPIADEEAYQKKLKITRTYLKPDMEVLEFGCGTGSTALLHAPYVKHILATDISANMLDIAREKAKAQNITNVTFEKSDIETFRASEASFDVVLGLSVLHLVADKDEVIAEVYRLLKPGGIFISSTACLADMSWYFTLALPLAKAIGFAPEVQIFTADDLAEAITDTGFTIEHDWRPGKNKAVFIVARKAGE